MKIPTIFELPPPSLPSTVGYLKIVICVTLYGTDITYPTSKDSSKIIDRKVLVPTGKG